MLFLKFTLLVENCIHVYFHHNFVFTNALVAFMLSKYIHNTVVNCVANKIENLALLKQ